MRGMRAETITALATLILAIGTVLMAFFTYRLAKSANESERADWRPILILPKTTSNPLATTSSVSGS
jgi:hypothetical protein